VLLGVGVLLAGHEAWAQVTGVERTVNDPERLAPFGLMLDAGVTDGTGLSVVLRPSRQVRVHLGGTYNGLRVGGRVGLTLLPVRARLAPALTLEVGHARKSDVETVARRLADPTQPPAPSLDRVGYTYGSALLGVEYELTPRCTFFLRGGASVMEMEVPSLEGLGGPFRARLGEHELRGGTFRAVMPSAKVGLVAYFG
jgi:hypothetical protein